MSARVHSTLISYVYLLRWIKEEIEQIKTDDKVSRRYGQEDIRGLRSQSSIGLGGSYID